MSKNEIMEEWLEMTLIEDYLYKSDQEDVELESIEHRKEFTISNVEMVVPNILMLKNSNGITEILNRCSNVIDTNEIAVVCARTNLKREDIVLLMRDGMKLDDILKIAEDLPFIDIAESAAIREMVRRKIEPNQLEKMKKRGVSIELLKDGSIKEESLEKIADIQENGLMSFDSEWERKLRAFVMLGGMDLSKKVVVKDIENKSLQVIPLEQKEEEIKEEEQEKQKIAEALGVEADDVLSVISIEDKQGGSKLFNQDMKAATKPLIVRLKNNKFKVLQEDKNGEKTEIIGFEATPVSKQVASLLKDTRNNLFTDLKPGEVKAGKTNPNQSDYNIFQIRRAGENKADDSNQLLFVGCCGETDMNIIESRENGQFRFDRVPNKAVYPKNIYIEDGNGVTKKKELTYEEPKIKYQDIRARRKLLDEVKQIERKIEKCNDRQEKLDLYSKRADILKDLGIKESESTKTMKDIEDELLPGGRHY